MYVTTICWKIHPWNRYFFTIIPNILGHINNHVSHVSLEVWLTFVLLVQSPYVQYPHPLSQYQGIRIHFTNPSHVIIISVPPQQQQQIPRFQPTTTQHSNRFPITQQVNLIRFKYLKNDKKFVRFNNNHHELLNNNQLLDRKNHQEFLLKMEFFNSIIFNNELKN